LDSSNRESVDSRSSGVTGPWTRAQVLAALTALLLLSAGVALSAAAAARLSLASPLREFRAASPRIANSKQGKPLFAVTRFFPGDVARSSVRIRNRGKVSGVLYLRLTSLRNTPPDQPQLSDRLWLRIWWNGAKAMTYRVWEGPLTRFHRVRVCVLRPRQARVFYFRVLFRGRSLGGWSDNSLMGHASRFGLTWRIVPRR
jgi:hypothetical protein